MARLNLVGPGWTSPGLEEFAQHSGQAKISAVTDHPSGGFCLDITRSGASANADVQGIGPDGKPATFSNAPTVYYRFWIKVLALGSPDSGLANFQDTNGGFKAALHISPSGNLTFYPIGFLVPSPAATGTHTIQLGVWTAIECQIGTGANAAWKVRINGVDEISGTNNLGAANNGSVRFGGNANYSDSIQIRDIAIDDSGFPGVGQLTYLNANGPGTDSAWNSGTSFSDWTQIAETVPDGDSSYVATSTNGAAFTARCVPTGNLNITGPIAGVKGLCLVKDGGATGSMHLRMRNAAQPAQLKETTPDIDPGTSYALLAEMLNMDPATSQSWGEAGVDGIEVGMVNSSAQQARLTYAAVVVDYLPPVPTNPPVTGQVSLTVDGASQGFRTLINGQAFYTVVNPTVGNHPLHGDYASGQGNFGASFADATLTVSSTSAISTSTSIPASPITVQFGTPALVKVVVSGASTPTGSVILSVDGVQFGTAQTLDNTGAFTFSVPGLAVGTHTLSATYTPTGSFQASPGPGTGTVNVTATTTTTIPQPGDVPFGNPASVTVRVNPAGTLSGTPSGSVTLSIDGTPFGSALGLINGQRTFSNITGLSVGSHMLSASYTPDAAASAASFSPSSTNPANTPSLTIMGVGVTVSIPVGLTTPLGSGIGVTVTVMPNSGSAPPVGTVDLTIDGNITLAAQSLSNGQTLFNVPAGDLTTVGTHTLLSNYKHLGGSAFQDNSGSGTVTVTSSAVAVNVVLSSPTVQIGQQAFVTVTVTDNSSNPAAGQVTLTIDGSTTLPGRNLNLQGQTTFTVQAATINSVSVHSTTATYAPSGNFQSATGSGSITVTGALTTTSINAPSASYFQSAPISVTVINQNPGGATPTGTVSLQIDGSTVSPTNQTLINGSFTFQIPAQTLSVSSHQAGATYTPDTNSFVSSTAQTQTFAITGVGTTAKITAGDVQWPGDVPVMVTLTSQSGGLTVTGNVNVDVDGGTAAGGQSFGKGLSNGTVSFPVAGLAAGLHNFVVTYPAQGGFLTSNDHTSATVADASTSVLISFAPVIKYPANAPITVTVTGPSGQPAPGSVNLSADGTTGPPQAIDQSTGQAQFSLSGLSAGPPGHVLIATYPGQGNFAGNSDKKTLTVQPAATSTVFTLVPTNPIVNQSFQINTKVTSNQPALAAGGNPAGSVNLLIDGTQVQSGSLSSGAISFAVAGLSQGSHALEVDYLGQGNFAASTFSQTLAVGPQPPPSGTSLTLFPQNVAYPQAAPVTVQVQNTINPQKVPFGTVQLDVDGGQAQGGQTLRLALNAGSVTFPVSGLAVGPHNLLGTFAAQNGFGASNNTGSVVITGSGTQTVINAPGVTYPAPASVTVTVSSQSSSSPPTGNVLLQGTGPDQTRGLSAGQAIFSIANLAAGNYTVTATYLGQGQFVGSVSQPATVVVAPIGTSTTIIAPTVQNPADAFVTVTVQSASTTITTSGNVSLTLGSGSSVTQPVNNAGQSVFRYQGLASGVYPLFASFLQQNNFAASDTTGKSYTLTVTGNGTTTAFTPPNPSVTFPADLPVVVTVSSGSGTPPGTVNLTVDGQPVPPQRVDPMTGSTTFTVPGLSVGGHTLSATYMPDATTSFLSSQGSTNGQILAVATTITLTAPSVQFGTDAQATILVSSSVPTPGGNATLTIDGNTTLTQPLDASGTASFDLGTGLSVSTHKLAADYAGQGNYAAALEVPGSITITGITTNMAIQAPDTGFGQPEQIVVTVTETSGTAPVAGTVTIQIDGGRILGQQLVNGSAPFSISGLNVGPHTVRATFAPQGAFLGSTGSATFNITGGAATTTTVTAPNLPFGQPVPITIKVTDPSGNPASGSVQLSVDGGPSTSHDLFSGQTIVRMSGLAIGNHTAVATFPQQGNFTPSTGSADFRVTTGCNCAAFTSTAWKLMPSATKPCYWSHLIDKNHLVELYYDSAATNYKLVFSWPGLSQCPAAVYTCQPSAFQCCGTSTFAFQSGGVGCNALPSIIVISNLGNCVCGHPQPPDCICRQPCPQCAPCDPQSWNFSLAGSAGTDNCLALNQAWMLCQTSTLCQWQATNGTTLVQLDYLTGPNKWQLKLTVDGTHFAFFTLAGNLWNCAAPNRLKYDHQDAGFGCTSLPASITLTPSTVLCCHVDCNPCKGLTAQTVHLTFTGTTMFNGQFDCTCLIGQTVVLSINPATGDYEGTLNPPCNTDTGFRPGQVLSCSAKVVWKCGAAEIGLFTFMGGVACSGETSSVLKGTCSPLNLSASMSWSDVCASQVVQGNSPVQCCPTVGLQTLFTIGMVVTA